MNEKTKVKAVFKEINLKQVTAVLLHKSWIIVLASVVCAVLAFVGSIYLLTPQYESSAAFYVNNSTLSIGTKVGLTAGDLSAAQELVDSYIIILESREALLDVIDYAGVNRTVGELRSMITAASVNGTEIFRVVVESPDPTEAKQIADAITVILPKRIDGIIEGTSAKVVEYPVVATSPSSPSFLVNTAIGFLLGVVFSIAGIIVVELLDVTVRSEEDVQNVCHHPVLAAVPDLRSHSRGGYYSRDTKKRRNTTLITDKSAELVGGSISFAASEAYKLLRTKLQFSFVDGQDCRVIGVSSAMAGEGKSISSVNLAYSLCQLDKRVLLIDCDMRRPSVNTKLNIKKMPGLSNYLTRQVSMDEVLQAYTSGDCTFNVICSGRNPPNPIELLSSARMKKALEQLKDSYDYIILDLPPVGEVSDALVAASLVDGILLVVRQNYCNTNALSAAVSQFGFVDSRVLGVVLNCAAEGGGRYKKGYKSYRNRYEGSYINATKQAAEQSEQD